MDKGLGRISPREFHAYSPSLDRESYASWEKRQQSCRTPDRLHFAVIQK